MKKHSANDAQTTETLTGAASDSVREALKRMHERDRARVLAGEIAASSLHMLSAADARATRVLWTEATTVRFKR